MPLAYPVGAAAAAVEGAAPPLTEAGARALVGRPIEIYWDGDLTWYPATVLSFDAAKRTHKVSPAHDLTTHPHRMLGACTRPGTHSGDTCTHDMHIACARPCTLHVRR